MSFAEWAQGRCRYNCNCCLKQYTNSLEFWQHVKNEHGLEWNSYLKMNPDYMVERHTVECR